MADLEPSVRARSIIVQIFTLSADSFGHFVRCGRNRLVSGRRVTACLLLEFAGGLASLKGSRTKQSSDVVYVG